eukprot:3164058-Pyramimonas_sp.AAC.1
MGQPMRWSGCACSISWMGASGLEPISRIFAWHAANRMPASFIARVVKLLRHERTISVLDPPASCGGEGGWRGCLPCGE